MADGYSPSLLLTAANDRLFEYPTPNFNSPEVQLDSRFLRKHSEIKAWPLENVLLQRCCPSGDFRHILWRESGKLAFQRLRYTVAPAISNGP
jgi:hypothetical protein